MPKDKGRRDVTFDLKRRAKEVYIESIGESMTNLAKEAVGDGLGEFYDDAVEDFLTNIPTNDLANTDVSDAFLELMKMYLEAIKAHAKDHPKALEILNSLKIPDADGVKFLDIIIFLEKLQPIGIFKRGSPEYKYLSRVRTILKKRIAIDTIDESELLRGKEKLYRQGDDLYPEIKVREIKDDGD